MDSHIKLDTGIAPPNRYAGLTLPNFEDMEPMKHSFLVPGDNINSIRNTVMSKFRAWQKTKKERKDTKLISTAEFKRDSRQKLTEEIIGLRFWRVK